MIFSGLITSVSKSKFFAVRISAGSKLTEVIVGVESTTVTLNEPRVTVPSNTLIVAVPAFVPPVTVIFPASLTATVAILVSEEETVYLPVSAPHHQYHSHLLVRLRIHQHYIDSILRQLIYL